MARIKLGNQFRAQFESIVKMYRGRYVSQGVIKSVSPEGNEIETNENVFEYNDGLNETAGSSGEGRTAHIDADGASWFGVFRGGKADTGNADWRKLIERVAEDYHRKFSFLEYKMPESRELEKARTAIAEKTLALLKKLFPNAGLSSLAPADGQVSDVYGLNLRLKIGSGMGETEPVLCQVFFIGKQNDENGKLRPMEREEARRVDMSVPEDDAAVNSDENISSNVVNKVFAAFEKLIEQDDNNDNSFSDYVLFDETDERHIRELLDHLANSEVKTLECSDVSVLGISHLGWVSAVFSASDADRERLRISIGLNNSVNVDCINCDPQGTPLIQENVIALTDGKSIVLDPKQSNMGLTNKDVELIRTKSVAASHLRLMQCPEEQSGEWLGEPCSCVVCESQLQDYGGVKKCANCPHPEIVYRDIFADGVAEGLYTPQLAFAHDKGVRRLVKRDELRPCKYCERTFTEANLRNGVCPICGDREGKVKYSLYKNMLSPLKRLLYLFRRKRCAEDNDIVVIGIGNNRYVFNKDLITEKGYIADPVKKKGK